MVSRREFVRGVPRLLRFAFIALACSGAVAQERMFIDPPGLSRPMGYSHVVVVPQGRTVYLSGQVPVDKEGKLVGKGDFAAQAEQVFANIDTALKAAHASFADVVKLTFYVTDVTQVAALRTVRDKYVDKAHPPANTLVEVRRLVREEFLLEVDAVAVTASAPVASVEPWRPEGVASGLFESHAAFDPRGGDMYFVRSDTSFAGWRILASHCDGGRWSPPVPPPFAGKGLEADPWFTPDGAHLYYISTRATGGMRSTDLDIWRVDRRADGAWGTPVRLPAPVNSGQAEWFPRLAPDGWLYFGSNRPGGTGKNDIWRARQDAAGKWTVENAGPALNTAGDEYEALPAPDGSFMVLATDGGYFMARASAGGWAPRTKLGPDINVNGSEIGAVLSPSGKSMLFSRDTGEPRSGEFFVWHREGAEDWPPRCGHATS
jgi:enamine deaminase RidA (YjgF/YER057c/UK114 family)